MNCFADSLRHRRHLLRFHVKTIPTAIDIVQRSLRWSQGSWTAYGSNRTTAKGCRQSQQARPGTVSGIISGRTRSDMKRDGFIRVSMNNTTYSCPCFIASPPVYSFSKLPGIKVAQRRENRLSHLGRRYQEIGMGIWSESDAPG